MRSDQIKLGFERAPHRGLLRATGVVGENDFKKPFIAVCNSYVDVVPGHVHLQAFGKLVKEAIRAAGGVPFTGTGGTVQCATTLTVTVLWPTPRRAAA